MSPVMTFRIAFKALGRNKMRTGLTMLGMIIGVAAVITMVALGSGAQSSIDAQIQTMGTNTIQVMSGNFTQGGVRQGQELALAARRALAQARAASRLAVDWARRPERLILAASSMTTGTIWPIRLSGPSAWTACR